MSRLSCALHAAPCFSPSAGFDDYLPHRIGPRSHLRILLTSATRSAECPARCSRSPFSFSPSCSLLLHCRSMPLTSDRWTADRFPVPRIYDDASPSSVSPLVAPPALMPRYSSSPQSSHPESPTSPAAPTSPFSPIARTDNRPFHLSAAPHPRWFTSHLHQLERDVSHSRSRLAEVEAEETYHFPDASEATHSKPLIPNQIKGFDMPGADTAEVKVCGDLAALGAGAGVAVWSASCDLASCASLDVGFPRVGPTKLTAFLCSHREGDSLGRYGEHNVLVAERKVRSRLLHLEEAG